MMKLLSVQEWKEKARLHAIWVGPMADAFVSRRKAGKIHPVYDFLFTYYNMSPQKLKQWVPSFEQSLEINEKVLEEFPWLNNYWFTIENGVLRCKEPGKNVKGLASFVESLCDNIGKRTPRFGCFGLHEWAMVYKASQEKIRYQQRSLRLAPEKLAEFVESQKLCCTHYDAFRFFTEEAKPLNLLNPVLETRLQMEQAGCVHANMDLYKWATKLWPWTGSDYIARAFFMAVSCRELDMRASPYDLSKDGFNPISIETEDGRRQYQKEQQELTERSIPLRLELQRLAKELNRSETSMIHSVAGEDVVNR